MPPSRRSHPGIVGSSPRYPGSFLLALREAAMGLKWDVRQIKGEVAQCADAEGQEHVVGLENLYRRARQVERSRWPELIADFLNTVAGIETDHPLPEKLEEVADRLLARLGPPLDFPKEASVWSQALPGTSLWINLVVDYPDRMAYVTEKLVHDSSQPGSRWLEVALNNLQARTPAESFEVVDEECDLRMFSVADSYDSSRSLILDRLFPDLNGDGCFAVMPGRDLLFVMPVHAAGIAHIPMLKVMAEKSFKTAPYPISDDLFWIRGATWQLVPVRVQGNQVTVMPPPELVEVFERLAPRDDDGKGDEPAEK